MIKKFANLFDKALTVVPKINIVICVFVCFYFGVFCPLPFLLAPLFAIIGCVIAMVLNIFLVGFFCQISEIRRLLLKIANEEENEPLDKNGVGNFRLFPKRKKTNIKEHNTWTCKKCGQQNNFDNNVCSSCNVVNYDLWGK